ncbi:MAG: ferritin-like domain-containing protein [Proteobacteria bacterium]|nr:ferritin-like domain-containing protein [Pseudomonadota bacterium]
MPVIDTSDASSAEILDFLNELLEAERAGARVALDSARQAPAGPLVRLLEDIRHDEARWCAMLLGQIARAGGQASPRMGAFHEKAMAIEDLRERLVFLNRGQGWVVRKLREMVPRVRDEELYAELAHMLSSHVANISLTNAAIG